MSQVGGDQLAGVVRRRRHSADFFSRHLRVSCALVLAVHAAGDADFNQVDAVEKQGARCAQKLIRSAAFDRAPAVCAVPAMGDHNGA